jgi:acetylornithine deacetylase/succinyl-diaminopimelate desuccinylase-like protein
MKPNEIISLYKKYVKKITPPGIKTQIRILSSAPASVVSTDSRWIAAGAEALEQVFNKKTVYMRSGGSIPVVGTFQKYLKAPSVMMGFGLPDDNIHAPNEKFNLKHFSLGIESIIRFLEEAGK